MTTITTRSGKGSPLTNDEVDANFTGLNTDKAELSGAAFTGPITTSSTVDGRDVSTDGTKLDGIEASADVTDTTNVTAAGALMDSELTSEASVKALNQGVATTDSPTFSGATVNGTVEFDGLSGTGAVTVTDILDQDDMSGNSATALATQQSIKAYVDSQVATSDTLAEVLANGNTTGGTDVAFGDNDKAVFGAGSDLEIYHTATGDHSIIEETGGGNLVVRTNGPHIEFDKGSTEYMARMLVDGAVELYYDSALKLATSSSGIDVSGTVTADDAGFYQSSGTSQLRVGASASYNWNISRDNVSTGGLQIQSKDAGADVTRAFFALNGDISFYEDTGLTQKLTWSASNESLTFGTNLAITTNEIDVATGDLTLDVAGQISLDADNAGSIKLLDGGSFYGQFFESGNSFYIASKIPDGDMFFQGNDGGSTITALSIDMSNAGAATFNANILIPNKIEHLGDADTYLQFSAGDDWRVVTGNVERFSINNSAVVINEESANQDFRVESNNNANALFVDGSNGYIGINDNSPSAQLNLNTSDGLMTILNSTNTKGGYVRFEKSGTVYGDLGNGAQIVSSGSPTAFGMNTRGTGDLLLATNGVTRASLQNGGAFTTFAATGAHAVFNENGVNADFRVESNDNTNMLFVDGGSNHVNIGTSTDYGGTLNVNNSLYIAETDTPRLRLRNIGNSDTELGVNGLSAGLDNFYIAQYAGIAANEWDFRLTGASREFAFIRGGVVNEGAGDSDFRVESGGNANMLFVDASANAVGIGTNSLGRVFNVYHPTTDGAIKLETGGNASNVWAGIEFKTPTSQSFIYIPSNDSTGLMKFLPASSEVLALSNSAVVVNEQSYEVDFRVETNNNSQTLFVDGGTDRVMIRNSASTTAPRVFLDIQGSGMPETSAPASVEDMLTLYQNGSATVWAGGATLALGRYSTGGGSAPKSRLDFKLKHAAGSNTALPETTVMSLQSQGAVGINTVAPAYEFVISKDGSSCIEFGPEGINSTTSFIQFYNRTTAAYDAGRFYGSNYQWYLGAATTGMTLSTSSLVVNESGGNMDFRVESDNNTHALFVDASVDATFFGKTNNGVANSGAVIRAAGELFLTRAGDVGNFNRLSTPGALLIFRQDGSVVGSVETSSTGVTYLTTSDRRLKENIADADDAGSKIDAIQVRKFDWKADGSHQDYGMIAQELQAVAPEAVSAPEDPDETMGVDYSKLVPMLIKEIQSLRARVADLES